MKTTCLWVALIALLVISGCTSTVDQTRTGSLPTARSGPLAMNVNGQTLTLPARLTGDNWWQGTGRGGQDVRGRSVFTFYNFEQIGSDRIQANYRSREAEWSINGVRQPRRKRRKCRPYTKTFVGGPTPNGQVVLTTDQCGGGQAVLTPLGDGSWNMEMTVYRDKLVFNITLRPA